MGMKQNIPYQIVTSITIYNPLNHFHFYHTVPSTTKSPTCHGGNTKCVFENKNKAVMQYSQKLLNVMSKQLNCNLSAASKLPQKTDSVRTIHSDHSRDVVQLPS